MYITQPGTYRADLQICGIDYKTNEVEVTGDITPNTARSFAYALSQTLVTSYGVSFPSCYRDSKNPVASSDTTLVVGSTSGNGAIYVFEKTNGMWTQVQKMSANIPVSDSNFPVSVAISGDIITCCTYGPTTSDGAVYIFEKSNGLWPSTETVKIVPSNSRLTDIDI